jgi:hypothetical protein
MPTEGHDAIITERIYTPLRIPGWTGTPTEIGGSGAAMVVVGDPTLGMRMRPAAAWYYDADGRLITTPISVVVERRVGAGYVMLTKTIPAAFIADALAAGAYVLADETTTTFYPNANVETTSVDGRILNADDDEPWATVHDATAGTSVSDSGTSANAARILAAPNTDRWDQIARSAFLFDTSALTAAATVSSATLAIYGANIASPGDGLFASPTAGIVSATPASNTALATADFDQFGTTDFATRLTTWSTSDYNTFTLNAAGLAAISLTGITKTGLRVGPDIDDSPPAWQDSYEMTRAARFAESTGTSQDPKLVVTYTLPRSAGNVFDLSGTFGRGCILGGRALT